MDISHRKVSKAIRVVDAAGNPVANKAVKVKNPTVVRRVVRQEKA